MNIKSHSLTLVQGHSDSTFSDFFFLETAWPIEIKFVVKPPWDGATKVCSTGPSYMTKMAAMPIHPVIFRHQHPSILREACLGMYRYVNICKM